MEKELENIFQKITVKSYFITRLQIPLRFKKRDPTRQKDGLKLLTAPSYMGDSVPKQKLDWQARLKQWKTKQTSKGTIKSFTDRKAEIWNSGITSILALL
jgi:hypothetical protein